VFTRVTDLTGGQLKYKEWKYFNDLGRIRRLLDQNQPVLCCDTTYGKKKEGKKGAWHWRWVVGMEWRKAKWYELGYYKDVRFYIFDENDPLGQDTQIVQNESTSKHYWWVFFERA